MVTCQILTCDRRTSISDKGGVWGCRGNLVPLRGCRGAVLGNTGSPRCTWF